MGLKQSIVVKSRFSTPEGKGKGSRGGSPGEYVKRYMARSSAVENIAPTRVSEAEDYLQRYALREKTADDSYSVPEMKHKMRKTQKKGGIAFGDGDPALSDAKLNAKSKEIQNYFDAGKTAIETILSFDEEYLEENGILDPGFVHTKRGDFAGNIDQLKLRMAIMNGMKKMSRNFDDLHYIGVIQVDTDHVHCHLVMMDYGVGTIASDGKQKGKLTALDMKNLRRGIDTYLDQKQSVKMMSSSITHDKRNALCYIKKFTHKTMAEQGISQFLLACLPKNRNLWSANSNRAEMRKPNAIVREFVMDILQPSVSSPSPMYQNAHESIVRYADTRQKREGLSESERMKLIRRGEENLIRDCMNGVYSVLRKVPKEDLNIRTKMIDAMSLDYETMAARSVNDPMVEFGFKLRSYSSRLKNHRKNYHKFRDEYKEYEEEEDKSEDSKDLGEYLKLERDYQQMLMVKYQHFLSFLPPDDEMVEEFEIVMQEQAKLDTMEKMTEDPSFQRLGAKEADAYGWDVYGINRGSFIKSMPNLWQQRVNREKQIYEDMSDKFKEHLHDYGFDFDGHGVTAEKMYPFDDVKALDLHHLGYDFPYDVQISKGNADRFVEFANQRYEAFMKARNYLVRTGQEESVRDLPETDVTVMKQFADSLEENGPSLPSTRAGGDEKHNSYTVRLGVNYVTDMKNAVQAVVESVRDL